ncbi:MAG: hypothetical protein HOQ21_10750, partial [Dermatophilaceae bacterium]|nr:hypothetical protein [Dermatophilaceae bacterium]
QVARSPDPRGHDNALAAYLWVRPHAAGPHPVLGRSPRLAASRAGRLAAAVLVGGGALAVVGGVLHPHAEAPNSHAPVFAEYAQSTDWVWVHDLQLLSAAVVAAGFLVVSGVLTRAGASATVVRLGNGSAAATVSLIGVNMAVDGVALKGAVDAWAAAGGDDKAARFAAAEAIRRLEWGVNSFFTVLLGVTVLLFATALLQCPRVATVLFVVMARGLPALDRVGQALAGL